MFIEKTLIVSPAVIRILLAYGIWFFVERDFYNSSKSVNIIYTNNGNDTKELDWHFYGGETCLTEISFKGSGADILETRKQIQLDMS